MTAQEQVQRLLHELGVQYPFAQRPALAAIEALQQHGDEVIVRWLEAARRLLEFNRDAGRVFILTSARAEAASEIVLPWTSQALKFLHWPGSAGAIEHFMRSVPDAYAALGHAGQARWAEIGFIWYSRHSESGRVYFATPVSDLAARQGITGIEQLCAPLEELYESRKLMLATYLSGALRVRNLLGAQAILPWAAQGAEIMQTARARGEAYFRLESEESLSVLLEHVPGFRMGQRQRLLTLLLTVWYERDFDVHESSWSPERGRPFVEADGRSLHIPAVMPDREEAILAVLHAAGRIVFGGFDRSALAAIFRMLGAELPASGPVSWAPLFERYGPGMLRFRLLFDLCEALRVDACVQRVVPNYLERLAEAGAARRDALNPALPYYDLALASVRGAAAAVREKAAELDPRMRRLLEPGATLVDAYRIADEIYRASALPEVEDLEAFYAAYLPGHAPQATRPAQIPANDEPAQGESGTDTSNGVNDGETPEQGEAQEVNEQGEASSELTPQQGGDADSSDGGTHAPKFPGSEPGRAADGDNKGKPYPEWDYRDNRYRQNWSWVQQKPLAESNLAEANKLTAQYASTLKRLKKAIQTQKPTRMAPKVRQFEGDEIDLNAAVAYLTELRAGTSPEAAIYRRREVRQREVAVTLLADISTSIMQHLPEGGGRLVDRVRAGVLLFAESMEEVGDAYSIAAFCSKYRDNVNYYTIKDFDQPLTTAIKGVIGGMSGRLATRMGAAIRHATARFAAVESTRRLLLILSDGRPEDYDDGGDRRYLHEDTRMAVKEAVTRGVHPFCVTVDTMANQYLPQIFGRGHYMVLDRMDSLPNKLPEIYLKLRR